MIDPKLDGFKSQGWPAMTSHFCFKTKVIPSSALKKGWPPGCDGGDPQNLSPWKILKLYDWLRYVLQESNINLWLTWNWEVPDVCTIWPEVLMGMSKNCPRNPPKSWRLWEGNRMEPVCFRGVLDLDVARIRIGVSQASAGVGATPRWESDLPPAFPYSCHVKCQCLLENAPKLRWLGHSDIPSSETVWCSAVSLSTLRSPHAFSNVRSEGSICKVRWI